MKNDVLGQSFEAETLFLPPDDEGEVVATLVRLRGPTDSRRAILYLHGYTDYFFQQQFAERCVAAGLHFYALDLRKCGRSIRPHQTPNFCHNIREYFAEIDLAFQRIADDGCNAVLLNGHSTGGLTASLYAHERRPSTLQALFLNSPFFELNAHWLARRLLTRTIGTFYRSSPYSSLPFGLSPLYGHSVHHSSHGEWDFDLRWKPHEGFPVRAGWLAAVHQAHREVQAGLQIPVPVLVMHSTQSVTGSHWTEQHMRADAVLDVKQIRRYAPGIGHQVTLTAIEGGMHDLILSPLAVREQVYDRLFNWIAAYGP